MQNMEGCVLENFVKHFIIFLSICSIFCHNIVQCNDHIHKFSIVENRDETISSQYSLEINNNAKVRSRRSATSTDIQAKCQKQSTDFVADIANNENENGTKIHVVYEFANESNYNLALAWASQGDDGVLLAVTTEDNPKLASSNVWRSEDFGQTWTKINDKIDNAVIRQDGVHRNPLNPKKIYLLTHHNYIYITEDGGITWSKREIVDINDSPTDFVFHSTREDYILTISTQHKLYITKENWKDKNTAHNNIAKAVWSTSEYEANGASVYCLIGNSDVSLMDILSSFISGGQHQPEFRLCKHKVDGTDMTTLIEKVQSFDIQGKFLYASVFTVDNPKQNAPKIMKVSTDEGITWHEAQLPTITADRFFSVLDMSEGLVFMHVDNPGDSGHGTLYTSGPKGIVYSESLERHLFPNFGKDVTDFYKVESMRGVYFASQIESDSSIHSMITYDRGAEWQFVPTPDNVECENKVKGCHLQIHSKYSITRGIKARLPLSVKDAVGLVLVHGHNSDALQTTLPDVFITTDGGYKWRKILDGPHSYQIANSGGLIVAIPTTTNTPKVIKFSTDEGRCFHEYKFTDEEINLTGLLTEPGGKSLTVSIWGYHAHTHKWFVHVIDFADVITRKCSSSDYEQWTPHETLRKEENKNVEGCLLGRKDSYLKLKPDSWCRNTYTYVPKNSFSKCICTREDFECEYGFERVGEECQLKLNDKVCEKTSLFPLMSNGFRLIPGDACENGFSPVKDNIDIKAKCADQFPNQPSIPIQPSIPNVQPGNTNNDNGQTGTSNNGQTGTNNNGQTGTSNNGQTGTNNNGNSQTHSDENNISKATPSSSHKTLIIVIGIIVLITIVSIASLFLYKYYLLRKHKVVYRYSLMAQNEGQDYEANVEGALTNTGSLYTDSSDEEQDTSRSNGNPFEVHKPKISNGINKPAVRSYHDDSDDDLLN